MWPLLSESAQRVPDALLVASVAVGADVNEVRTAAGIGAGVGAGAGAGVVVGTGVGAGIGAALGLHPRLARNTIP